MTAALAGEAVRRRRRSVVVLAGDAPATERPARALVDSLGRLGVETVYLGRVESAGRIAHAVAQQQADAVELCVGRGCVVLLRDLLRELIALGRRDVSIVVHRLPPATRSTL